MDKITNIENFVDDIIEHEDYQFLDILWIFSYSLPFWTPFRNGDTNIAFQRWFGKICSRNLKVKHNLNQEQINEKMSIFIDFLNENSDFLPKKE